eukprot:606143-Pyramimonas_sp.AAC.1
MDGGGRGWTLTCPLLPPTARWWWRPVAPTALAEKQHVRAWKLREAVRRRVRAPASHTCTRAASQVANTAARDGCQAAFVSSPACPNTATSGETPSTCHTSPRCVPTARPSSPP